jgi:hypothetical protein
MTRLTWVDWAVPQVLDVDNGPVVLPRMLEQNPVIVQAWRNFRQIKWPIRDDVFLLDVE